MGQGDERALLRSCAEQLHGSLSDEVHQAIENAWIGPTSKEDRALLDEHHISVTKIGVLFYESLEDDEAEPEQLETRHAELSLHFDFPASYSDQEIRDRITNQVEDLLRRHQLELYVTIAGPADG